jgi:hypothetical protein
VTSGGLYRRCSSIGAWAATAPGFSFSGDYFSGLRIRGKRERLDIAEFAISADLGHYSFLLGKLG